MKWEKIVKKTENIALLEMYFERIILKLKQSYGKRAVKKKLEDRYSCCE